MAEQWSYIPEPELRKFGAEIFQSVGLELNDAELLIDTLIQAELWGHESHGLLRLGWYYERIKNKAMRSKAEFDYLVDSDSMLLVDSKDSIGQVTMSRVSEEVSSRAKRFGIAVAGIRNSNHFGTAMYFTRHLAKENLISILTTNASPSMAPWGGSKKVLGNNPWSIAAPYKHSVVALDMANTVVARGKIYSALEKGETIPPEWALTRDGKRTTDPEQALAGVILPMGGHKGYAISFMMDVLSGVLTGSQVGQGVNGPYNPEAKSGVGHLLIAIDAARFADPKDYEESIDRLIGEVKASPLAEGFDRIYYPGELEDITEAENKKLPGIKVYASTLSELRRIGEEVGVAMRLGNE